MNIIYQRDGYVIDIDNYCIQLTELIGSGLVRFNTQPTHSMRLSIAPNLTLGPIIMLKF